MQNLRDKSKRIEQWSDYKRYRNKTKQLIRQAKRNYFSSCINEKIWGASTSSTLINKSIATGQFPAQLEHAKVHPIHKSGEKSNPSNCRPISILPTISKIIEKHVNKHLMAFLN